MPQKACERCIFHVIAISQFFEMPDSYLDSTPDQRMAKFHDHGHSPNQRNSTGRGSSTLTTVEFKKFLNYPLKQQFPLSENDGFGLLLSKRNFKCNTIRYFIKVSSTYFSQFQNSNKKSIISKEGKMMLGFSLIGCSYDWYQASTDGFRPTDNLHTSVRNYHCPLIGGRLGLKFSSVVQMDRP